MEISIVIPVFNEIENLIPMINKIEKSLKNRFNEYEIIFVNDGSTDGSYEVLEKLKLENKNVFPFHLIKNSGQSAALAVGFKKSKGELVVMMDGDLQTDPEDIHILLKHIPEYDMVNGYRSTREDGINRQITSKIANSIRNWITKDNIRDTGCPLKLFKKEVIKSYAMFDGMHRFLPTLAKYNGFKVTEAPVRHYNRIHGISKYSNVGRVFKTFVDVFAVRWMRTRILKYKIIGD